jgi:hypothetical protein
MICKNKNIFIYNWDKSAQRVLTFEQLDTFVGTLLNGKK